MQLLVSLHSPHNVLAVERFEGLFGYTSSEIVGRGITALSGPKTDLGLLRSAIAAVLAGQSAMLQMTFYDREGSEQKTIVEASPYILDSGAVACRLCLKPTSAITLQEAFEEVRTPRALISAERPHLVQMVNQGFNNMFHLESNQALGCPIHQILGADEDDWAALLRSSSAGHTICSSLHAHTSPVPITLDVLFIPVIDPATARIVHTLAQFTHAAATAPTIAAPVYLDSNMMRISSSTILTCSATDSASVRGSSSSCSSGSGKRTGIGFSGGGGSSGGGGCSGGGSRVDDDDGGGGGRTIERPWPAGSNIGTTGFDFEGAPPKSCPLPAPTPGAGRRAAEAPAHAVGRPPTSQAASIPCRRGAAAGVAPIFPRRRDRAGLG